MNRRNLLRVVALSPIALAACQGRTTDQLTADINLIATGLSGVVGALRGLPGGMISPAIIDQAQGIIDQIKANAASIGGALTPNPDTVQAIAAGVDALQRLLVPFFPVAPGIAAVVQAALALIPLILAAVGRAPSAATTTPMMTPAQARAALRHGV